MVNSTKKNKIQNSRFPAFIFFSSIFLLVIALFIWFFYSLIVGNSLKSLLLSEIRAVEASEVILQYDEVLTMSANMYVATGDKKWEERYNYFEIKLREAISEVKKSYSQPDLVKAVTDTDQANEELVRMERQAFALMSQGNQKTAKKILFGSDYQAQKKLYSAGMHYWNNLLKSQIVSDINFKFKTLIYASFIVLLFLISVSILYLLFAYKKIMRWKNLVNNAYDQQNQLTKELEQSQQMLEHRVKERTKDLEKVNESLEESESRFNRVLESTPVGLGIILTDGQYILTNHAANQLVGYTKEEMLRLNIKDVVYSEDLVKVQELTGKLLEGSLKEFLVDIRLIHKDKHLIWVFLAGALFQSKLGEAVQIVCQVHDISLRKNFEANIVELNNNMVKVLAENEVRDKAMMLLTEMNKQLQSALNYEEALSIIGRSLRKIFPNISTVLSVYNQDTHHLSNSGKHPGILSSFSMDDCWGLREGHIYSVDEPENGLFCKHYTTKPKGATMCIPMMIKNEITGVLNLIAPEKNHFTEPQCNFLITFTDVIKLSLANIRLREYLQGISFNDKLTGLSNRRYLDEFLPRELKRSTRENKILLVAMLDLDYFKKFNDDYGHDAGDEVLRTLGTLLQNYFRGNDTVCRYGGEEFVILITNDDFNKSVQRLQEFCVDIKKERIVFDEQVLPPVTVSIGIAQAPLNASSPEEILRLADEAMYQAKKKGRDRVEIYQATDTSM